MLGALKTLAASRAASAATLPAQLLVDPFAGTALAGLRARNAVLDGWFYDVSALDPGELLLLSGAVPEGTILRVPPTGQGAIGLFADAEGLAAEGGDEVHTLCVAGVGSSALGSAAFARNVADATGRPAAAVVSGYGTSDFLAEAMGGWFLFGSVNRFRHYFELVEPLLPAWSGSAANRALVGRFIERPLASEDVVATLALLLHPNLSFSLLVGHSKGNLVVAEALSELVGADASAPAVSRLERIVTISAAIFMPKAFGGRVIDVMGEWDPLGLLNSSPEVNIDLPVPRAGHHTNTQIAGHLPVRAVLEALEPIKDESWSASAL